MFLPTPTPGPMSSALAPGRFGFLAFGRFRQRLVGVADLAVVSSDLKFEPPDRLPEERRPFDLELDEPRQ